MSQNWARYWRPREQCPGQGSDSLIRRNWTVLKVVISRRVKVDSNANMGLEQEGDALSGQREGLGNRTLLNYLLSWAKMDPNELYSCECSSGQWVTRGLSTHQTKAKVFSLGREGVQETE